MRNVGEHPLQLSSTYVCNSYYENGELVGEEIGDWQVPGGPVSLRSGETKSVLYVSYLRSVGLYAFRFVGFGAHTEAASVVVLPPRWFLLVIAAIATALVIHGAMKLRLDRSVTR